MHTEWTDRLSDYLDGQLPAEDAAAVEAHLDTCPGCATVSEELRAVSLAAQSLDVSLPPHDLWAGIQATIGRPVSAAGPVIDLASRRGGGAVSRGVRTVRLSVPQLVAASLALVFVSGTTAWLARPDAPAVPPVATAPGAVPIQAVSLGNEAVGVNGMTRTDELAGLEALLASHKESLSPNTVRILAKNLAAIDRAITESMQALASDPGNEFLEGHLERSRQRKLEYLQEASLAFQWST